MWTSLPTAFVALVLLSDLANARFHLRRSYSSNASSGPDLHVKRSYNDETNTTISKRPASLPSSTVILDGPGGLINKRGEVVTVTVQPMPVGIYDGVFYPGLSTDTGGPSGIFPPGPTGSGTGTPHPTGVHAGNVTSSTSTTWPEFTESPKISIPIGAATATATPSVVPNLSTSSLDLPDFTKPAVISIPGSTIKPTRTKPSSTSATATPTLTATVSSGIPFLRGVNLGGWLVLEKWMNDEAFTGAFSGAIDQYTFDSISGSEAALEEHWSTFFTDSDISEIAATGINALRIPIGYWSYDNSGTPYKKGADAYLEKAIGWARSNNMKVWVDCHGSPGSQNGFDNSGQAGSVNWQQGDNMDKSISILKIMAAKYGKKEYADVVVGLQLVNEPISWGNNNFETTKSWTKKAYAEVRSKVENENLVIVMHDGFMGGLEWAGVAGDLLSASGPKTFGVDEHLYQLFTDSYNAMDQSQHITAACSWASNLAASNAVMPTYVGEWSAATNICVNPDGSTTSGTSCSVEGCQCQVDNWTNWNEAMIEQIRRFVEAQLDVFESSTSGYFIWAAKGPGGWGFLNGIRNGAIPNPVTERKYPGQCGGGKKRGEGRRRLKRADY